MLPSISFWLFAELNSVDLLKWKPEMGTLLGKSQALNRTPPALSSKLAIFLN
jgi:hypothetical protein